MITKSDFVRGMKCPKELYERKKHPELFKSKETKDSTAEEGTLVGNLVAELFANSVRAIPTGKNIDEQIKLTQEAILSGKEVISEAAFKYGDLFCRVDYLEVTDEGLVINEVKAKTDIRKKTSKKNGEEKGRLEEEFLHDFSFQYHVLESAGYKVTKVNAVYLNSDYKLDGELEVNELFIVDDVTDEVLKYCHPDNEGCSIKNDIEMLIEYLGQDDPKYTLGTKCKKDGKECEAWEKCSKNLTKPNVFDLNGSFTRKRDSLYLEGLVSFPELIASGKLNDKGFCQVEAELTDSVYVNEEKIREFLTIIRYPLYFLDFETYRKAVPEYDGQWPYEQVPFQYSLHYIESPGAEIKHVEFLGEEGKDPRRQIALSLVDNIPEGVCVTAYYKSFERDRLRELADMFPDLSERLLAIADNLVDFIEPFDGYWLYNKEMQGKSSIKYVLPALFPDDETLNYKNLPGVQRGNEAMDLFPRLSELSESERIKQRAYLLRYCRLDTFAMIKVYEALLGAAGDERYEGIVEATTKYAAEMKETDIKEDEYLRSL